MEHAEKMYLVSHHQMEQIHGRPPTIGTMAVSWLDTDMKAILQRTDLKDLKHPPAVSEKGPPSPQKDPTTQEILEGMSTRYKKNAELLLSKMKQHQDILGWDDHGTVSYNGTHVYGTNIVDLVKGVSQHQSRTAKYYPKGWNEFMSAMAEMNVPTIWLGSNSVKEQLEMLKEDGTFKSTSSNKQPSAMSTPVASSMSKSKSVLNVGEWLQ
ncbi:hypothetical protein E2320_007005, partial [Naja naja]